MHRTAFAILLVAFPGLAVAQPRVIPPQPTIVVNGEATVRRAPDRAYVTFATETRAAKPDAAQQANARAMEKVRKELRDARIPADAIRTTAFNLREEVDWVNGSRVPRGFVATNAVEVRVDDLQDLGELIGEVVDAGATSVSGIRFDLRDREAAEREALRQAVVDARARADAAAAGAGVRIVQIQTIQEDGAGPTPPPMPMMRMEASVAGDAVPAPIAAGEIEIQASVRLTAVIEGR